MRYVCLIVLSCTLLSVGVRAADDPAKQAVEKMREKDSGTRLAGIWEAREIQDEAVTKELIHLLLDKDPEIRKAAAEALGLRAKEADRRRAATALASRLSYLHKKTGTVEEQLALVGALEKLARPEGIKALLDIKVDEDRELAKAKLMAVANVPSAAAIEGLIGFLSKGRNRGRNNQRELGRQALRWATGEKMNRDPDVWRAWWRENKKTFDFAAAAAWRREQRDKEAKKKEAREKKKERQREQREKRERQKNQGKKGKEEGGGREGGQEGT